MGCLESRCLKKSWAWGLDTGLACKAGCRDRALGLGAGLGVVVQG